MLHPQSPAIRDHFICDLKLNYNYNQQFFFLRQQLCVKGVVSESQCIACSEDRWTVTIIGGPTFQNVGSVEWQSSKCAAAPCNSLNGVAVRMLDYQSIHNRTSVLAIGGTPCNHATCGQVISCNSGTNLLINFLVSFQGLKISFLIHHSKSPASLHTVKPCSPMGKSVADSQQKSEAIPLDFLIGFCCSSFNGAYLCPVYPTWFPMWNPG